MLKKVLGLLGAIAFFLVQQPKQILLKIQQTLVIVFV